MKNSRYACAIGLYYDPYQNQDPAVALSGQGHEADMIVKLAYRYGKPVITDPDLAEALKDLDLDQSIPPSLYQAVALLFKQLRQI